MPKSTPSLIERIASREKSSGVGPGNYGIQPASNFVKSMATCVGTDLCNRYGSLPNQSFHDALKRAEGILTYSDSSMVPADIYSSTKAAKSLKDLGIELPKDTLMVFKHRLTSDREDRDGDILKTGGATLDPNMLLLWNHVHTMPIGKFLGVAEHTHKSLDVYTAIVGINELADDAAVMVENKMLRFSHGFRATSFEARKASPEETDGKPEGFIVKTFEIMEESGVTVPANTDAEILEVYVDLVESDKLTSSLMKGYGRHLRRQMKAVGKGFDEKGCSCGGTPEETGDKSPDKDKADGGEESSQSDKVEPTKKACPKCDGQLIDGTCNKCGYKETAEGKKPSSDEDEKKGKKPEDSEEEKKENLGDDEKVMCKKCGSKMVDGTCPKCAAAAKKEQEEEEEKKKDTISLSKTASGILIKGYYAGVTMSGSWEKAQDDLRAAARKELTSDNGNFDGAWVDLVSTKAGLAVFQVQDHNGETFYQTSWEFDKSGKAVINGPFEEVDFDVKLVITPKMKPEKEATAFEAGELFITKSTEQERKNLLNLLGALVRIDDQKARTSSLTKALN